MLYNIPISKKCQLYYNPELSLMQIQTVDKYKNSCYHNPKAPKFYS